MKRLSHYQTRDQSLQRWTSEVRQAVDNLQDSPMANGVLIEDVELVTGATTYVNHGLQRAARGWIVVDTNRALFESVRRLRSSEKTVNHIALICEDINSSPATISLWVF
jgi:hypothetical protein